MHVVCYRFDTIWEACSICLNGLSPVPVSICAHEVCPPVCITQARSLKGCLRTVHSRIRQRLHVHFKEDIHTKQGLYRQCLSMCILLPAGPSPPADPPLPSPASR